jgi:hypothetical protein
MSSLDKLRDFVIGATKVADANLEEEETVSSVKPLLAKLIEKDDWLPDAYAQPHPDYYRQYLLHCSATNRIRSVLPHGRMFPNRNLLPHRNCSRGQSDAIRISVRFNRANRPRCALSDSAVASGLFAEQLDS